MHANLPKFALLANRQSIIKILGILRVDGTGKNITEVLATLDFLFGNTWIYLLSSILYGLRILVRQTILCEDSMHLNIVVAFLTQNVDNLTHDIL